MKANKQPYKMNTTKTQMVLVEWVDAEFHQMEVDAKNIVAGLPPGSTSVSRSTGILIYADEQKLVLAGTRHVGGNETYRDLLVIPQGMVVTVHELSMSRKLFPHNEENPEIAQIGSRLKTAVDNAKE